MRTLSLIPVAALLCSAASAIEPARIVDIVGTGQLEVYRIDPQTLDVLPDSRIDLTQIPVEQLDGLYAFRRNTEPEFGPDWPVYAFDSERRAYLAGVFAAGIVNAEGKGFERIDVRVGPTAKDTRLSGTFVGWDRAGLPISTALFDGEAALLSLGGFAYTIIEDGGPSAMSTLSPKLADGDSSIRTPWALPLFVRSMEHADSLEGVCEGYLSLVTSMNLTWPEAAEAPWLKERIERAAREGASTPGGIVAIGCEPIDVTANPTFLDLILLAQAASLSCGDHPRAASYALDALAYAADDTQELTALTYAMGNLSSIGELASSLELTHYAVERLRAIDPNRLDDLGRRSLVELYCIASSMVNRSGDSEASLALIRECRGRVSDIPEDQLASMEITEHALVRDPGGIAYFEAIPGTEDDAGGTRYREVE